MNAIRRLNDKRCDCAFDSRRNVTRERWRRIINFVGAPKRFGEFSAIGGVPYSVASRCIWLCPATGRAYLRFRYTDTRQQRIKRFACGVWRSEFRVMDAEVRRIARRVCGTALPSARPFAFGICGRWATHGICWSVCERTSSALSSLSIIILTDRWGRWCGRATLRRLCQQRKALWKLWWRWFVKPMNHYASLLHKHKASVLTTDAVGMVAAFRGMGQFGKLLSQRKADHNRHPQQIPFHSNFKLIHFS